MSRRMSKGLAWLRKKTMAVFRVEVSSRSLVKLRAMASL